MFCIQQNNGLTIWYYSPIVGGVQQAKNGFLFVLPPHKVVVTYKKQDFVFYLGFLAWFNPPHRQFRFGLFSI